MQTVVATSKLIEKRGDIVTTLENRSLLLKKKLAKEREESYQSFKNKLDESKRKNKGRNVLATVATGGAGAAVLNRFRPRRPSVTSGRSSGLRKFNIFRSKPRITGGSRVNTNILRGGSKLNSLLTVAFTGYDFIDRKNRGQTNLQAGAGAVSTSGGAIAGGAAGAAIGTAILPGVGTVIGGILGSFIGASAGGSLSDSITGANSDTRRKEEIKKLATPQASLFSGALDTFDVVLEKFAKLRASDFDRSKREDDRIPLAISRPQPGTGGVATKLPTPQPKTPKVPPRNIPNPIVETIKDVGLITLGVGLVVGATVLAGPTGPDDVAAYASFAAILNKTKLGRIILAKGPKILKALRNADTVKRMNDAIRNKKNFPKLDKRNLERIKKSDKIIKDLRKEGAADKIIKQTFRKKLQEEVQFNIKYLRDMVRSARQGNVKGATTMEKADIIITAQKILKTFRQNIKTRGADAITEGRRTMIDIYETAIKRYEAEIFKYGRDLQKLLKDGDKRPLKKIIKKYSEDVPKTIKKVKSNKSAFNILEGNNTTNVINGGSNIAFLPSGDNEINMIELNGYMRQV